MCAIAVVQLLSPPCSDKCLLLISTKCSCKLVAFFFLLSALKQSSCNADSERGCHLCCENLVLSALLFIDGH